MNLVRQKMARQSKNQEQIVSVEDADGIVRIVAQRLQDIRTASGLSQTQLAERAGVKQTYIYELEYGDTNFTIKTLDKMAKALNADIRDMFPGPALALPSGGDLKHLHTRLDELLAMVKEYLSSEQRRAVDEQKRYEAEVSRRRRNELNFMQELQGFEELRQGLARLIANSGEHSTPKPQEN
jgi:transcriptional regulator with XRE-family HTH domain